MGREQVIAECMAGKGVEYLPAAPWLNQDAQPRGLSFEQSIMWLNAFYGEAREDWSVPASEWKRRGCLGVGEHAVAVARAAGTPLSAPVPKPDQNAPTEAEERRSFDEAIQSCMTEKGFGAFDDGTDAWWDAMYGDAGTGAAYRWEDAGCSGYATTSPATTTCTDRAPAVIRSQPASRPTGPPIINARQEATFSEDASFRLMRGRFTGIVRRAES